MFVADPSSNALATQVTLAGIVVALMQWLKKSRWFPWLTTESAKVNRVVAAVLAAVAAIGVHITWNAGALPGSYMLNVTGLTLVGVLLGIWEWMKSYVMQQIIFHTAVSPTPLTNGDSTAKVADQQAKQQSTLGMGGIRKP